MQEIILERLEVFLLALLGLRVGFDQLHREYSGDVYFGVVLIALAAAITVLFALTKKAF